MVLFLTPYDALVSQASHRIAYELLSDGVLDNTLDDLPAAAGKLLGLIKKYLAECAARDSIPLEKIIFERKKIREYTSWSFAQVRNNFRILREYEYLQLIKARTAWPISTALLATTATWTSSPRSCGQRSSRGASQAANRIAETHLNL